MKDNYNQNPNDTFIGEQISLSDENVKILYQYVTYGSEGIRNPKLVNSRQVTIDSFTDAEKLYYALQFAQPEDFEFTGEYDANKKKLYVLPMFKLTDYLKRFFGPAVKFQGVSEYTYTFSFTINKTNVGTMKYNDERSGYDTVFDSYVDIEEKKKNISPVYGQLISALRKADGSVVLQERIVYTDLKTENGGLSIDIYKDPEKTTKLGTMENVDPNNINESIINLSNYASTAIAEYTFGINGQQLYFQSSRIIL